jgi:hypothetical protein
MSLSNPGCFCGRARLRANFAREHSKFGTKSPIMLNVVPSLVPARAWPSMRGQHRPRICSAQGGRSRFSLPVPPARPQSKRAMSKFSC